MRIGITTAIVLAGWMMLAPIANAGLASKVVREAAELTARKFSREVAEEGVETMAAKMTRLAAKHGDEVVAGAFTKVGPRAANVAGEAGEHGGLALRLLAQHGDHALTITISKKSLGQVARHGDDVARALLKHGTLGETLIDNFGPEGARALARITPQNGRRLAMLSADGALKPDVVAVVAHHGDRACDFIWRNKGALAVGATLATFLTSPGEFLDGTASLAEIASEAAIKPLAAVPGAVAGEAARRVNWNLIVFLLAALVGFTLHRWGKFTCNVAQLAAGAVRVRHRKEVRHDG